MSLARNFHLPDKSNTSHYVQSLLTLFRKGNEKAKLELIEFSFKRFKKFASKMLKTYPLLRTKADTDDLLQNFLIRLTKAFITITPENPADFFKLVSVLMRNELIDMGRKLFGKGGDKKNFEQSIDPAKLAANDPYDGPANLFEWVEFHETIDKLPEEEKEVFQLIFYQGFNQDEVSNLLGLSIKTVFRRWTKAKLILSDKFL